MKKSFISTITAEKLRIGEYENIFPEIYSLKSCVENNPWHLHQSAFDHIVKVLAGLESIFKFTFLDAEETHFIGRFLNQKIGALTHHEVLVLAAVLHDNAKGDTLVVRQDGTAVCLGHELIGASRIPRITKSLGLDSSSRRYLQKVVMYHGLTSDLLNWVVYNKQREKYLEIFTLAVSEIGLELAILKYADVLGSDLMNSDNQGFRQRVEILEWMIKKLIRSAAK